jgi:tetratricopeptide (TPR) repeat protein
MRKIAFTFLLLVAFAVHADDFSNAVASLESAWMNDDMAATRAAIESLKAMREARPAKADYAIGYGERRLAFMRPALTKNEQQSLIDDSVARFESVIKAEPQNAEAHALLASSLGILISFNRMAAMTLGPRSGQVMQKAQSLAPNNPRVLLLAGISAFKKPAEYGGGLEIAEPLLRRAASIFAQEPADRPWPNWGRFEAHIWLGQLLAKSGKRDAARTEYDAALAIAPRSQYVRAILIPELSK